MVVEKWVGFLVKRFVKVMELEFFELLVKRV